MCLCFGDGDVAFGFGAGDGGAFFDARGVVGAEVDDESVVVGDVLDIAGDDLNAEFFHVLRGFDDDLIGKAVAVGVDRLKCERADDLAHVALKGVLEILCDLGGGEVEEVARGELHALFVAPDHDFGNGVDVDVDVVVGGDGSLCLDVDGNLPEEEGIHALQEGDAHAALSDEDARGAFESRDDECGRRRCFDVGIDDTDSDDDEQYGCDGDACHDDKVRHSAAVRYAPRPPPSDENIMMTTLGAKIPRHGTHHTAA